MVNQTNLAYICHACENMNLLKINIFSFSGNRTKTYECSCGHSEITLVRSANNSVKADLICPACKEEHSYVIPANQFWTQEAYTFPCPYYEATALVVGSKEKISARITESLLNDFVPEFSKDNDDYITHMEQIVCFFHDVEKNPDKYRFCECGCGYSTAYNGENIYIICNKCGYSKKFSFEEVYNLNITE